MSDLKIAQSLNGDSSDENTDAIAEPNLLASLNKLLEESPEFKSAYDSISRIYDDDPSDDEGSDDEGVEVEYVEIDGHDYIIAKEIEISGTTYLYLVNENDILDFRIQKVIVEDGKEYITGLDSEREFELAQAYILRDILMEFREKLKRDSEDKPDNP